MSKVVYVETTSFSFHYDERTTPAIVTMRQKREHAMTDADRAIEEICRSRCAMSHRCGTTWRGSSNTSRHSTVAMPTGPAIPRLLPDRPGCTRFQALADAAPGSWLSGSNSSPSSSAPGNTVRDLSSSAHRSSGRRALAE